RATARATAAHAGAGAPAIRSGYGGGVHAGRGADPAPGLEDGVLRLRGAPRRGLRRAAVRKVLPRRVRLPPAEGRHRVRQRDLSLERLDSGWGRARIDESLRHRLDPEVEALESARAQEDQVPRFAEYHLISRDLAGDVHEHAAGPALEERAVGLAEQPLVVALDSERVEEIR